MHYFADNPKGISAEKLAGDFEIYPLTERHLPHRMRKRSQEKDLVKCQEPVCNTPLVAL